MTKILNDLDFLEAVKKELIYIKYQIPQYKLNELFVKDWQANKRDQCLYGLLFGDCYTIEATEFISKSTNCYSEYLTGLNNRLFHYNIIKKYLISERSKTFNCKCYTPLEIFENCSQLFVPYNSNFNNFEKVIDWLKNGTVKEIPLMFNLK